ncbi:MAG TPA: hypothetical protein VHS08_03225 [Candidatus Acidoferrales bacterium]|nr:hypothetical protein [Candidatus Acidoferrales bacterium]
MGEKTDEIEQHIGEQRRELGRNLNELQQKVKDSVNWRSQFEQHPAAMLGIAVGSGLLLSAIVGSGRRTKYASPLTDRATWDSDPSASISPTPAPSRTNGKASEHWNAVKAALIGVAASKLGDVIEAVVPGFNDEYSRVKTNSDPYSRSRI